MDGLNPQQRCYSITIFPLLVVPSFFPFSFTCVVEAAADFHSSEVAQMRKLKIVLALAEGSQEALYFIAHLL